MRVEGKGKEKLRFFQDLYVEAKGKADSSFRLLRQHMKQYKGSRKIDGSDVDAIAIRNITYELIESQVSSYIPSPKVDPTMYSDRNIRCAKSIETLLLNKRNQLPFEKMNDADERYSPIYGGSLWLVEWDDSITTHNTVGDVRISCLPPTKFIGQPNIYEINDMEYCFIEFDTTKEDIMRKYGVSGEIVEDMESENADDKTATLIVCYYKNDDDKLCEYIWSGDTEVLDVENYYQRKREYCTKCGKRKELCECEKPRFVTEDEDFEELDMDIQLSDGSVIPAMSQVYKDGVPQYEMQKQQAYNQADGSVMFNQVGDTMIPMMVDVQVPKLEKTKIPFYTPSVFPIVIRRNTSQEESLLGQSDCEYIRPQQQEINKIESRIHEKLMGGGVYPMVPDDYHDRELDNSIFKRVFRVKPNQVNMFGRVDLTVDVSRDIQQSERIYEHAKRILGITDTYRGINESSAQSGVAKQVMVNQSAGRLESKRQMKNAAYSEIDQIIFQYFLAYADEPRPAVYRDATGRLQNVEFNRYDFVMMDENGEYYYNDEFLFSCDTNADISSDRSAIWKENVQMFQLGAYGNPQMLESQLIFWQNMESAHYPWSQTNVERIQAEIERQAQMAQMQQQIDGMQNELTLREGYENELRNRLGGMNNGNQ